MGLTAVEQMSKCHFQPLEVTHLLSWFFQWDPVLAGPWAIQRLRQHLNTMISFVLESSVNFTVLSAKYIHHRLCRCKTRFRAYFSLVLVWHVWKQRFTLMPLNTFYVQIILQVSCPYGAMPHLYLCVVRKPHSKSAGWERKQESWCIFGLSWCQGSSIALWWMRAKYGECIVIPSRDLFISCAMRGPSS